MADPIEVLRCRCCGNPVLPIDRNAIKTATVLGPRARGMLDALIDADGQIITSNQIVNVAYADDIDGGPEHVSITVSATVKRVRQALVECHIPIDIQSLPGKGFRAVVSKSLNLKRKKNR